MRFLIIMFTLVACHRGQWDGASCEEHDDCNSGMCARSWSDGSELPGGVCTYDCWETQTCPYLDMTCVRHSATNESICLMRCANEDECREGWRCGLQPLGVCVPE